MARKPSIQIPTPPPPTPFTPPASTGALERSAQRLTQLIPLADITIGDQLLRHDPDDDSIIELAYDLATRGQLQPIGVIPTPDGRWQLLYGHRRILALTRLQQSHVLATLHDPEHHHVKATALAENLHRRNLSLSEECEAVRVMHHDGGKSPDQISVITGKSRHWVLKRLAIPNYPDDISTRLFHDRLTLGQADVLAAIPDEAARLYLTTQAELHRLRPDQLREMAAAWLSAGGISDAVDAAADHINTPPPTNTHVVACIACGTRRDLNHTILIRVCADGCTATRTTSPDHTHEH